MAIKPNTFWTGGFFFSSFVECFHTSFPRFIATRQKSGSLSSFIFLSPALVSIPVVLSKLSFCLFSSVRCSVVCFLYLALELAAFTFFLRLTSYLQSYSDMNECTLPSSDIVSHIWLGQWALPSFDPQCLAALLYLQLTIPIPRQSRVADCSYPNLSPASRSFVSSFITWRLIMDD